MRAWGRGEEGPGFWGSSVPLQPKRHLASPVLGSRKAGAFSWPRGAGASGSSSSRPHGEGLGWVQDRRTLPALMVSRLTRAQPQDWLEIF